MIKKAITITILPFLFFGCSGKSPIVSNELSDYNLNNYSPILHKTELGTKNNVIVFSNSGSIFKVDSTKYSKLIGGYNAIITTPGEHSMFFYLFGNHYIRFNFKANHKYLIDNYTIQNGQKVSGNYWLYDLTDKKTVDGKKDEHRIYQGTKK